MGEAHGPPQSPQALAERSPVPPLAPSRCLDDIPVTSGLELQSRSAQSFNLVKVVSAKPGRYLVGVRPRG